MPNYKCAFLTCDNLEGFVVDDEEAVPTLKDNCIDVDFLSWTAKAPWENYDVVIIRAAWDYQNALPQFLEALSNIDQRTTLLNPLQIVRWNCSKNYLRELESRGVQIVPTLWPDDLAGMELEDVFEKLHTKHIIFKPLVGANADRTYPLRRTDLSKKLTIPNEAFTGEFLAQTFMPCVISEGEFSLFYFNGEYSHTILKTPIKGDYRVQEEHGGIINAAIPSKALLECGQEIIESLDEKLLYARVDVVRGEGEQYHLMELELIEPSLYFRMDKKSPKNFASALKHFLSKKL